MSRPTDFLAIASGKGGVGKTWLAVTMAHVIAELGRRAMLLDGDIGLANVDIQLGIAPTRDLSMWSSGASSLDGLVLRTDAGFDIIPGASGTNIFQDHPSTEIARLMGDFARVAATYDARLIDIGAGIETTQLRLASAAGRCLLVVTEDPTSLTDGYAFIKLASRSKRPPAFEIVVNMAESEASGRQIYNALARASKAFLGAAPPLAGIIRRDPNVAKSIRRQTPLLDLAPNCPAAQDVKKLAASLLTNRAKAA